MRQEFSTSWTGSRQPRKQRKYRYNAPLHVRHKFLSAHLSKDLRAKHGKRSMPVRKGDEVLVMRGSFKKKKAKVSDVNAIKKRITLEGISRQKKDGSKVPIYFEPSNLQIISIEMDDKKRIKAMEKNKNAPNKG